MLLSVRFDGNGELDFLEAVRHHCLIVVAPSARVASTFRIGVVAGIQMTVLTPRFCEA